MGKSVSEYRGLSYWHDSVPDDLSPRAPLPGGGDADVAIVGGGLTGLWTAYYLGERDPSLRIVVLEKHIVGFGASGRNGGWCSALFPSSAASLASAHGRDAAIAMRAAMVDTVNEVDRVTRAEGIDCDFVKGGTVSFIRSPAQRATASAEVAAAREFGVDQLEFRSTRPNSTVQNSAGPNSADQNTASHNAAGQTTADRAEYVFDPACARLHPAKLVRGLARVLERRGVSIFEQTEVLDYQPREVRTSHGALTARHVIVATEGYGATLPCTRRTLLPLYSLMIATEPLSEDTWASIGIEHGQTFTDYRHLLVYGQRTADNRIAFGGRGARYHWGSSIRPEYDRAPRVFGHLRDALIGLFPEATDAAITHTWGGPLGVPRDWHASVSLDRESGIGWAGGYVGDGLSTTNLAGRTLADLITGTESAITRLPWVGHRSPEWEPEPLRFAGANLGLLAMGIADLEERITKRPSITAKVMGPLVGH